MNSLWLILFLHWERTLLSPLHNAPWVIRVFLCLSVVVLLCLAETETSPRLWTLWIFLSDSFNWVLLWLQIVFLYTCMISTELKSQRNYRKDSGALSLWSSLLAGIFLLWTPDDLASLDPCPSPNSETWILFHAPQRETLQAVSRGHQRNHFCFPALRLVSFFV